MILSPKHTIDFTPQCATMEFDKNTNKPIRTKLYGVPKFQIPKK
jgi:hypothetical protein